MWDPWADSRATEELRGRLKWFLLGRLAVISCFMGMIAISYLSSGEESYVVSVNELLFAIASTYGISLVSALLLPRTHRLDRFAHVQLAYDILLVTGVIYLTGGVDSPFPFLYSLPIINAAVLMFAGGAMISALLSALAYDCLVVALVGGLLSPSYPLPPVHFDLHVAMRLLATDSTFILIAYLAGILTRRIDATERLLRERQIERDNLKLMQETIGRTIGTGLLTTDPEGKITSADQTAAELSRRALGELTGTDLGHIFAPLDLTPSARLRFLQSGAQLEPIEFSHERGPDDVVQLRCTAAPLRDTFGHVIGGLYVLQNVTRLKELETSSAEGEDLEALCREDLDEAEELAEALDGLYGISPAMRKIRDMITRIAASDATVLIAGESGTGKEVAARAIHSRSPRRDKAFVAINCGAIPEHLIESELFGHVRGAFTGAVADRPGCFRVADGGTIFLDEIGELPFHLQVKLLRVLQERVFRPVGSESSVAVNVRIIAASNRDLQAAVKAGTFREDLFYRLDVITVELPPLRERREDIPLLTRHFLRQFSEMHHRKVARFSVGASRMLLQHRFPGNVRELENIIEHAVALCEGDTANEEHLPAYLLNGSRTRPVPPEVAAPVEEVPPPIVWAPKPPPARSVAECVDLERDLAEYEKAILLRALDQAGGVKKRAAALLGINYRSLRHRLQKYGLGDADEETSAAQ